MARVSAKTKHETLRRLLAAAAQEFGRVGFERANIDAISLAAGFAKGTIYNYFHSKEDLFLAVVEDASTQATAAGVTSTQASARERLESTLAGFCNWAKTNDAFARVLVRECLMGTPNLYPRVAIAETPLLHAVETIVGEGAERGELRSDLAPDLLTLALLGLTDLALAQHWATGNPPPDQIPALILQVAFGPGSAKTP